MSTSSEDVLLQVPSVRYKKGDGSLFLMDTRLIWMVENRDTVAVSHSYADIKSQKISPEGKAKVQLQVVLHNGVSSTFHFTNKNGLQGQLADRDKVKEMLQSLLPKFKRKVDKELEEKNKLLSTNPTLLQLYKDLVMTEVVTSEEFWAQHAVQYTQKHKQPQQSIGVSGAFLADIKPQTDGCNGLKYNITPDIIECIFKTYPAVKKKYLENVPAKLTETQFWTKFFQSHYFHRDRKYAESKDVFTECGKLDDQEMKKDIQKGVDDPLVNLTEFEDKSLDEGYGIARDKPAGNIGTVSQSMIKRFNQHSIMVLKASNGKSNVPSASDNDKASANNTSNVPVNKKQKIIEKITYEDLESEDMGHTNGVHLNLSKVERYLHGPMPDSSAEHISPNEASSVLRGVLQETRQWQARSHTGSLVSPAAAVGALGELSPGGALMRGFQEQSLAQLVPSDIEKEVRNLYLALCELLAHFWKCFPPTTSNSEQKVMKMHEALQRFQTVKLKPFEDKLIREFSPLSHHLTKHLNQLLNAAYQKFNNWQKIKGR
ncbi:general transcription factor IIH subunit 1 [Cylas formicarius]|uniref:general transcription factor IIH subunit 1 n=1 Tax=Cylas formicarius TaxID=197179 RepID=UPI002958BC2E|nr:general transcription factor IIH subunit 1 [Cylas formicarius]XP_060530584.1 general transcription factor IIH subunit 1 [Cylas formicarius]XP_060530585.1 general transcription factor IIH subunit 1 [Cylas formicarius]XP_060530586.1 general transcription factor IIH subunit 1 [Cylas formicarius]